MDKHVQIRWKQGVDFTGFADDGARVAMAGEASTQGFRPAALILAALAGCSGMDAISILFKKRQVVTSYELDVRGEQRADHPRTYMSIVVEHRLEGEALDDDAVMRSIELAATRYCVANAHLSAGDTTIEHRYRIRDAQGERSGVAVVTGPLGAGLALSVPA